ncbi:MAG: ferritin-like domain-containing protein [Vicinamibacterales bacterium]
MAATDRELWVLNFYRNSELHGALLMGRLARTLTDTVLLARVTRHCATEARHAAMLSETIAELGGSIDPHLTTVQEHYSAKGGVPPSIVDLLVLSEILEHRVLTTYRAHLTRADVAPPVRECLTEILHEMEEEDDGEHAGWIDNVLRTHPHAAVETAHRKWHDIDTAVAGEIERIVAARFPDRQS